MCVSIYIYICFMQVSIVGVKHTISYQPKTDLKPNARTRARIKVLRIPNTRIRLVCWKVDNRPTLVEVMMRSWYNNKQHSKPLLLHLWEKLATTMRPTKSNYWCEQLSTWKTENLAPNGPVVGSSTTPIG
jgi:hypothetical protein